MQVTEQMQQDFASDGAIVVRGLFSPDQLQHARECFDYSVAHPSPLAGKLFAGTDQEHFNEYGNYENRAHYLALVKELGLADFAASLFGSEHIWFLGEELFIKSGGKVGRSPWHQDTAYVAANGPHMANFWISFEPLPRECSLEVVRGSHLGPEYDGTSYNDPDDVTRPLWGDGTFPRLPDIEAERAKDPSSWDVLSWAVQPGDVVVLHSGTLHGGAPLSPACPTRHTLVLRFFGDQLFYRPLPTTPPDFLHDIRQYDDRSMSPGEPFRAPYFDQLR